MIIYVWGVTENHAIERAYACYDYQDLAEALRKKPADDGMKIGHPWTLYKLEVSKVEFKALMAEEVLS